ncbi:MAG: DUF456 domain-containing protein, partial [Vicinamibacteria bacterium]
TPLIVSGALLYAFMTDFQTIGVGRLLILVGFSLLAYALDYTAGALGVRRFGGSSWAVVGAVLGAVVGVFFGPIGLVLGPILGSVLGELLRSRKLKDSLRSAFGTGVGMLLGVVAKLSLAVVMVGLVLLWIWNGAS